MKSKLDLLNEERNTLAGKIAELEAQQKSARAEMEADPIHKAASLAPRFGDLQTQIEVFTTKLGEVGKHIEAEQARLNSPEVTKGLKRAEKIIADGQKLHGEIFSQLETVVAKIDAATVESQEAASLLRNAGRDFLPFSGPYTELAQARQLLGGLLFAKSERANMTAGFKQAAAAQKARHAAQAAAETIARAEAEKRAKAAQAKEQQRSQDNKSAWSLFGTR